MKFLYEKLRNKYLIAGNFRGVQLSRMASLQSFRGLIFTDASNHIYYILYNFTFFMGLIFTDIRLTTKSMKTRPHKNFPLYGKSLGTRPSSHNYFLTHSLNFQVTVHVLDGNDHSPVFDPALYPIAISESTSVGSTIVRVFASDNDIGTNAMLSYNITTGNASGNLRNNVSILHTFLVA